ncbi:MAG: hypothetical protein HWE26_13710 [Alteromonadaceae bacterium]|nr:hypothetical protein [Alteromonadaceae bacterium]
MLTTSAIPAAVDPREFLADQGLFGPSDDQIAAAGRVLVAAQDTVETATGRPLGARAVEFAAIAGLGCRWFSPVAPMAEVTSITWSHRGSAPVLVDPAGYWLEAAHDEPQIVFDAAALSAIADGARLTIAATVGADLETSRSAAVQAVRLIAGEWFNAALAVEEFNAARLSMGAWRLIKQARYRRPAEWDSA